MQDSRKTKAQLIEELEGLRRRVAALKKSDAERKRAEEELKRRIEEMSALNLLAEHVSTSLSLADVVQAALKQVVACAAPDFAVFYLREGDRLILQGRYPDDSAFRNAGTKIERVGQCLCGLAAEGKPVYSRDITTDPRCTLADCKAAGIRSFAALPLLKDNHIFGVLGMASIRERDFEERSHFLETLVGEVAIGLHNALLHEEAQRYAAELKQQVAECKRVEKALRESEERYRSFVQNFQGIAFRGKMDFTPIFFHGAVKAITGYTEEEFISGKPRWDQIIHEDDLPAISESVEKVASVPSYSCEREYRIVRKDGEIRWVYELIQNICDNSGEPDFVQGAIYDITERKRSEEATRAAERELEMQRSLSLHSDRLRSLGQIAAGIAHELNQPLVGVRGLAEHLLIAMEREWNLSEEKVQERIKMIVEQADRMTHIIDHVRMFARESGKPDLSPVNVNDAIKSSVGMLEAQFQARGVEMVCELDERRPLVLANQFSLEEVILNLLLNARDAVEEKRAADPSSTSQHILLRTAIDDAGSERRVAIQVIDSGIGIPEDLLGKVFDPFFTTKGPDKGTGLGLAISRSIVESFGGTIRIASTPDKGTTVTISLPAQK